MSVTTPKEPLYTTPAITAGYPGLLMAESTRHGGVSLAPFASLNLGIHTKDDPTAVAENRRRFWKALGIEAEQVAASFQVHGDAVKLVTEPGNFEGYDALITNVPGIFLAVTAADCTPILIYDPVNKAVAAIHSGWRGTVAGITNKTIARMTAHYGTVPGACIAYIGTCIDQDAFEVGEEVARQFDARHYRPATAQGKFLADLKAATRDQLLDTGVKPEHIEVSPFSTFADNTSYFSYRKENSNTGRMLAVAGLRN